MHLKKKIRNVLRSMLQKTAPASLKSKLWDKEFAGGHWDYIDNTPGDCVYPFIEKYCRGGSILDLGCGSGNTGNELNVEKYGNYTGIDVSGVAVQMAASRSRNNGRASKNEYFQSDIIDYASSKPNDVILFRESIMYVPNGKIKKMLDGYRQHLKPGGVFIVRMCDREKYADIRKIIKDNYQVVEEYLPEEVTTTIMVFR
jgi:2-polyprenyl-3-methyl-5-hydroxy-6-metoxy-1,4-benzoquinol methylase